MGWFSDDGSNAQAYNQVYQGGQQHQSSFTHEVIGGAAAFEAMRAYEQHEQREGKPANHALAKELIAGFAGAEVDKLFETKGLDYIDQEKAKRHAQQQATYAYDQQAGGY